MEGPESCNGGGWGEGGSGKDPLSPVGLGDTSQPFWTPARAGECRPGQEVLGASCHLPQARRGCPGLVSSRGSAPGPLSGPTAPEQTCHRKQLAFLHRDEGPQRRPPAELRFPDLQCFLLKEGAEVTADHDQMWHVVWPALITLSLATTITSLLTRELSGCCALRPLWLPSPQRSVPTSSLRHSHHAQGVFSATFPWVRTLPPWAVGWVPLRQALDLPEGRRPGRVRAPVSLACLGILTTECASEQTPQRRLSP